MVAAFGQTLWLLCMPRDEAGGDEQLAARLFIEVGHQQRHHEGACSWQLAALRNRVCGGSRLARNRNSGAHTQGAAERGRPPHHGLRLLLCASAHLASPTIELSPLRTPRARKRPAISRIMAATWCLLIAARQGCSMGQASWDFVLPSRVCIVLVMARAPRWKLQHLANEALSGQSPSVASAPRRHDR